MRRSPAEMKKWARKSWWAAPVRLELSVTSSGIQCVASLAAMPLFDWNSHSSPGASGAGGAPARGRNGRGRSDAISESSWAALSASASTWGRVKNLTRPGRRQEPQDSGH